MPTAIRIHRILDYYDCPQIVECRDPIGGQYLAVKLKDDAEGDFVAIGMSPEQLRRFRGGEIDLLAAMSDRPLGWSLANFSETASTDLVLKAHSDGPMPPEYLALEGFFLNVVHETDWLLRRAKAENNLMLSLVVDPKEASMEGRIHAETLGKFLVGVQKLLKCAYSKWIRDDKPSTAIKDGHVFDVLTFAPASFNVVMAPTERVNLFGSYEGIPALNLVKRLFSKSDDPEQAVEMISSEFRGHLAVAYREVLRTAIASETGIELAWADPEDADSTVCHVSLSQAKEIFNRLSHVTALEVQTGTLIGRFFKMDTDAQQWGLDTEDGKKVGYVAEGGPSLAGLVGDAMYRFEVEEKVGVSGGGAERSEYFLTSYEAI